MKTFVLSIIVLSSLNVFANSDAAKLEAIQIANVILDNPIVAAQIKTETLSIIDYSFVTGNNGVNQFTFKLARTCFCMPETGTLTVTQDLRSTFADGAIEYTTDLKIDKQ